MDGETNRNFILSFSVAYTKENNLKGKEIIRKKQIACDRPKGDEEFQPWLAKLFQFSTNLNSEIGLL